MAGHADTTLVVLNQIDRIAVSDREGALADVRRLVSGAGLSAVPVLAVSAATGEGIGQLRHEIAARIGSKRAALAGLSAEVAAAAQAMAAAAGASLVPGVTDTDVKALTD